MKTNRYILASLLIVSGIALAQKGNLKRVNKLFEMRAYAQASEIYETKERTQTVLQNLADSYYYNTNLQQAIKTYRELFVTYGDSIDIEYHFRYAQALKGVRDYKEADKQLSRYFNKPVNTNAFIAELEKTTPHTFTLKEIDNPNVGSDFGLSFYGEDEVAFASSRNSENPSYAWNDLPYLDLYHAKMNANGIMENIVPFSDEINTDSHESNVTFSKDGKTMYFNRTNKSRIKSDGERIAHVKIFKAEFVENKWTNVKALPFNSNAYSTEHPSLSKDGKTLFFARCDAPDCYGDCDIFMAEIY